MHRMHRLAFNAGLIALLVAVPAPSASAALLRPTTPASTPTSRRFANGYQTYTTTRPPGRASSSSPTCRSW